MNERESWAYYLGGFVVGMAYLLLTLTFIFWGYLLTKQISLLMLGTIIVMGGVNIFLFIELKRANKYLERRGKY